MLDQRISAEDVSAAVRIHADRVHDLARRLRCAPADAVEVVETSALDLVHTCTRAPGSVRDLKGWWFARARALAGRLPSSGEVPVGGGVLAADADQTGLAEALDGLPEDERVAVLLRDAYALPVVSVAAALGVDLDAAMERVGRGRLRFVQAVGGELPRTAGHAVDLGALARLAESSTFAARDATTRRHAQSCAVCRAVWDTQQRAHELLAGVAVVALPEAERSALLARVDAAAQALPTAAQLAAAAAEPDEEEPDPLRSRWLVPLYGLLALFAAVVLGLVIGVLALRGPGTRVTGSGVDTTDPRVLPPVSAAPLPTATFSVPPPPSPAPQPSTSVFTVPPSPTPSPTSAPVRPSPTPSPEPARDPLTLTADPSAGPNGQQVTVSGTGWQPGGVVTLDYLDPLGRPTGSRTSQQIDARGRFTTTIAAQDPANLPGRHTIRARDGSNSAAVPYDAR